MKGVSDVKESDSVDQAKRRLAHAVAMLGGYAALQHVPYESPVIRSFIGVRNAYAQATGPMVAVTPTHLVLTATGSCSLPIELPLTDAQRATVSGTFTVTNTGTIPVTLQGVSSNNPAITIVNPTFPQVIGLGQAAVVTLQLTCTTAGNQNALLTLDIQSALGPVTAPAVSVDGSCGIRGYAFSPKALDYGQVLFNTSHDRTSKLTNTGFEPLTVTALTSSFPSFTVVSPLVSTASPLVLGEQESATVTIRLSCVNATQTQSGQLSVTATTPGGPVSCDTVSLLGECVVTNPKPNPDNPEVRCAVAPDSLDFGTLDPNGGVITSDLTFTISNTGDITFTVSDLTPSGNTGPPDFNLVFSILSPAPGFTLSDGESQVVTVRATCDTDHQGDFKGQVAITATNGAVCPPVELEVECDD